MSTPIGNFEYIRGVPSINVMFEAVEKLLTNTETRA